MEAVNNGFTTIKCAPFDECRAPFDSTGLPHCAEAGLERVQTIREAVGPDITIFVDCHSRFDLDSALALEPELAAAGGQWFEEPVDPVEHSDDLRTIHEHANLPIAGGEHAYGVNLFKRLVDEDVLDIVMPDVKFCGGPVEAYRIGTELEPAYPGSVSMHCPSGPTLPPRQRTRNHRLRKHPSTRTRRLRSRLATRTPRTLRTSRKRTPNHPRRPLD